METGEISEDLFLCMVNIVNITVILIIIHNKRRKDKKRKEIFYLL